MQNVKKVFAFFQEHILVVLLFAVSGIGLFLGDGKQALIDSFGAVEVFCLYVVAVAFLKRRRGLPSVQLWAWGGLIAYLSVRSLFSDDVGYSVYSLIRYVEAFVIYYLFVSYGSKNIVRIFSHIVLVFSLAVFIVIVLLLFIHSLPFFLPRMNLLYLTYGHNHAADIFLIAFPVSSVLWSETHKRRYFWCAVILVIGTMLSFARAALVLEALFVVGMVAYNFFVHRRVNKKTGFLAASFVIITCIVAVIPYSRFANISDIFPKFTKPPFSLEARSEYWRQAAVSILKRPLFGSGPGTFYLQSKLLQSGPNEYSWFAHSSALEYVSETGIVGFFLIAALLGTIAYWLVRAKLDRNAFPLLCGLILISLQSLVDYTFDYLVVWLLLWATVGVLCSRAPEVAAKRTYNPLLFMSLVLLAGFYTTNIFIFYGGNSFKNTTAYTFFCAYDFSCMNSLLSSDNSKPAAQPALIEKAVRFFHRKNPDATTLLASYFQKIKEEKMSYDAYLETLTLDPQNNIPFEEYVSLLLDKKQYDYLLPVVELITTSISNNQTRDINYLKTHWDTLAPCFTAESLLWPHRQLEYTYQVKSLYYAGLCLIKNDRTDEGKELLRIAVDARAGWSNIYLDYAALSFWHYNDTKEAERSAVLCKENINSRKHCASYDDRPLQKTSLTDETVVFVKQ